MPLAPALTMAASSSPGTHDGEVEVLDGLGAFVGVVAEDQLSKFEASESNLRAKADLPIKFKCIVEVNPRLLAPAQRRAN